MQFPILLPLGSYFTAVSSLGLNRTSINHSTSTTEYVTFIGQTSVKQTIRRRKGKAGFNSASYIFIFSFQNIFKNAAM